MLIYIAIAFVMFALGFFAAVLKNHFDMMRIINSNNEQNEVHYQKGHKEGWHAALEDRLMVASKYHEYYGPFQN